MTSSKFIALSVAALLGTAVLLALGAWQVQRMNWKADLLARLEARAAAEPVTVPAAREMFTRSGEDVRFLRIAARGRYDHDKELHLYGIWNKQPGWHIITPFETSTGERVLVIRGFVPDALKRSSDRPDGQPGASVDILGTLRFGEARGMFTPDNDEEANHWFWRDLSAMQRAAGSEIGSTFVPFFLELEAPAHVAAWPRPAPLSAARLHNRHFGYAVTWFGLAAALVVIYGLLFRAHRNA